MTSNISTVEIQAMLQFEGQKDPNIQIASSVGHSAEFLDVLIENDHGRLKTSVFHKPAAEPYILPYLSDHPRHMHRNTPYNALLCAARVCSDVQTFDQERLRIEITLLLNGYPPSFISKQFHRFFRNNNAMLVYTDLNDEDYQSLHRTLLKNPMRVQREAQATNDTETLPPNPQLPETATDNLTLRVNNETEPCNQSVAEKSIKIPKNHTSLHF